MKKQFGFVRRCLRLGKNVEHFKAAAVVADAKSMDPVLQYCAVGRQLGYAMYLTFDMGTFVRQLIFVRAIADMCKLDAAGIRPSTTAERLQREAFRAWMIGLIFSGVSDVYTLWQLRQRERRINKKDGQGVVESKKIERYDS